jgi:hypothetical protein
MNYKDIPTLNIKKKYLTEDKYMKILSNYVVQNTNNRASIERHDIHNIIKDSPCLPYTISFYKYFFIELLWHKNTILDKYSSIFNVKTTIRPYKYESLILNSFLDKFTNIKAIEDYIESELNKKDFVIEIVKKKHSYIVYTALKKLNMRNIVFSYIDWDTLVIVDKKYNNFTLGWYYKENYFMKDDIKELEKNITNKLIYS